MSIAYGRPALQSGPGYTSCYVLQLLGMRHNNILRNIAYNNFRCHITPLYKSPNFVKLHVLYLFELAKQTFLNLFHLADPKLFIYCWRPTTSVKYE